MLLFALAAFTGGMLDFSGTGFWALLMGTIGGFAGILIATRRRPQLAS